MNSSSRLKKIFIALGAVVFVIFTAVILFGLQDKGEGVDVKIHALPKNAKLTVDGKSSGSDIRLIPGKEYTFQASAEGFKTSENTVLVDQPMTVVLALEAVSDEAKEYQKKNEKLYLEAEGIVGRQTQERGIEFVEKNPILKELPHDSGYYRIDYTENENSELVVLISSDSEVGRRVALEKIKWWGHKLHDYRIEFVGFKNPFIQGANQ